jgi:hypothetical protein
MLPGSSFVQHKLRIYCIKLLSIVSGLDDLRLLKRRTVGFAAEQWCVVSLLLLLLLLPLGLGQITVPDRRVQMPQV